MKAFLKANAGHLIGVALFIAVCVLIFRVHREDSQADKTVKAAQADIGTLQKQQAATTAAATVQVTALRKRAASITTAPAAIAAMPSVERPELPLEATKLPDDAKVSVDAVPLYDTLNECKQDEVLLNACTLNLADEQKIVADKQTEIVALKAKPRFLTRFGKAAKIIGCSAAGGFAGGYVKGAQGAAVGAAAGATVCQAF